MTKNPFYILVLYYQTLRYLSLNQITFKIINIFKIIFFQFFSKFYYWLNFKKIKPEEISDITLEWPFEVKKKDYKNIKKYSFNFLNQKIQFESNIEWKNNKIFKNNLLWQYNLNYHNFLLSLIHDKSTNAESKSLLIQEIITDWINNNDLKNNKYDNNIWNSYVVSNRIISWVKLYTHFNNFFDQDFKKKFLSSLRFQLKYLNHNLEYHLRANHLLENSFALIFGSVLFNDKKIFEKGQLILNSQLKEQIMIDGAHFELSPMYHQHISHRLLDLYYFLDCSDIINPNIKNLIKSKLSIMLGWLEKITFSNGDIPTVNDCSFGIYPSTRDVLNYASNMDIEPNLDRLCESGYRFKKKNKYELFFDSAQIGPAFNPGHGHNDVFNFILYIEKIPFIVDTGTSTYNFSKRRLKEKSTSSHNTVSINGQEQSEIWSNFRVAKRVNPKIIQENDHQIIAQYSSLQRNIYHQREINFYESKILLKDVVNNDHLNYSYLHFHPSIDIEVRKNSIMTSMAEIKFSGFKEIKVEDYSYAEGFNLLKNSKKLKMIFSKESLIEINIFDQNKSKN
mgnify:FL=1|tara:strand:- start:226 stop:1917 length:1692 start_codon:yes stop_codon:yes gene_type:complete